MLSVRRLSLRLVMAGQCSSTGLQKAVSPSRALSASPLGRLFSPCQTSTSHSLTRPTATSSTPALSRMLNRRHRLVMACQCSSMGLQKAVSPSQVLSTTPQGQLLSPCWVLTYHSSTRHATTLTQLKHALTQFESHSLCHAFDVTISTTACATA